MTRLPIVDARTVVGVLNRLGFTLARTRGSHQVLKHPDGRWTVVPMHAGRDISRPLLRKILHQADVSVEEFTRQLAGE